MKLTFKKGIHPRHSKYQTEKKPIEYMEPKDEVVILMQQHIGAPCKPLVAVGDTVLKGQKIGEAEAFVSAPIHSTVSGKVKKIGKYSHPNGSQVDGILIENDHQYTEIDGMVPKDINRMSKDEILTAIKEAGIVGMGGAGFPTFIKLNPPKEAKIDHIIVNGAECEPYLTSDHRVMLEETERVVLGLDVILRLFPDAKGVIAIEDNKPDAIEKMEEAVRSYERIEVATLKTKYPQGAEKQLIYSVTKREVPSGKLPADAGCIVQNIDTVVAIHRAIYRGRPLMRRVVTVSGKNIKKPGNYKVMIGTTYRELIEHAGGTVEEITKMISGEPMMGIAMFDIDVPIIKTSSSILMLADEEINKIPESACIRCGKCVEACPMNLLPLDLDKIARQGDDDKFTAYKGMDCIECGSCSYSCPAKRHLVHSIRTTKRTIMANRRK